ncbi:MAG: DUF5678 domain-containing protein [Candidatus Nitrosocosmicus sp.]
MRRLKDDFNWFVNELDTTSYQGKYIAIWNKHVVGVGDNAVEVDRQAKEKHGKCCNPAITYIPRDEITI